VSLESVIVKPILPTTIIRLDESKPKPLRVEKQKLSELESDKVKLKKATHEFEAFFMSSMLKSMRQTIPKSDANGGVGDSGLGKDIYQSMFDEELSRRMADSSRGGLADILYQNLVKRIESKYASETESSQAKGGNETRVSKGS
jgi:Rod binding domain-containing protein